MSGCCVPTDGLPLTGNAKAPGDDAAKEAADARRYGLRFVDENQVSAWCDRLEGIFNGRGDRREGLGILYDLERGPPFARGKVGPLRRLLQQERIRDVGKWRDDGYRYAWAIKNLAAIWNWGVREQIKRKRRIRVELSDPLDIDRSPLVFHASVYIEDRYHGSVACVVTDNELATLNISTRSLSNRQARLRRINDYYRCFEVEFPSFIEKRWEEGVDLTVKRQITWAEIRG